MAKGQRGKAETEPTSGSYRTAAAPEAQPMPSLGRAARRPGGSRAGGGVACAHSLALIILVFSLLLTTACNTSPETPSTIGMPPTEGSGGAAESIECAPSEPTTLTLWHSYREDERTALEAAITRFNDSHPMLEIAPRAVPFDAYPDRLSAAIPLGRGPDMFIFAHDRIGNWAERPRVIEPLNKWLLDPSILERFFEPTVLALVYKHQLYGLPLAYKSLVLYYNTDLIASPPQTTDEMIQLALRHTTRDSAEERFGLVYEYTQLYFHVPWIHGFGGSVLDAGDQVHIHEAASVRALQFAAGLYRTHRILPDSPSSQSITSLFNQGRAAMVINGPWFRAEIEDVPYSVAPLPVVSDTEPPTRAQPFLTVEAMMMSAGGNNQNCTFEAMVWFTTDPEGTRIRMEQGHQPVALQSAYGTAEAAAQGDDQLDPALAVFRDQMLSSVPTPNTPMMLRVWANTNTAIFRAIKNGDSAAEVLATARERIEEDL